MAFDFNSILSREIGTALEVVGSLIDEANGQFIWRGGTYEGVPQKAINHVLFGAGGFVEADTLILQVRLDKFPDPTNGPAAKQTITYLSKVYRIDAVETNPDNTIKIICNDLNRAAGKVEREM